MRSCPAIDRVARRAAPGLLCALLTLASTGLPRATDVPGQVLNLGGNSRLASGHTLTNDALGDSAAGTSTSLSGRFRIEPHSAVHAPIGVPGEVVHLSISGPFDGATIHWDNVPGATAYNIYRAEIELLVDTPPTVFDAYVCGEASLEYEEWQFPAPNELYAYVVNAVAADYESTIGSGSYERPRVIGTRCP